ncbi:Tetratricopeptide repeat-containing protein [Catalinimonas alkaloidigena]|uniref:Tetratricopeptide repeat-containing protein n=1 Tax=Catalinimonas alkaloidigena TaxID=1075417 RepID=A0A1G9T6L8_9BACT|nr:tetratricopeptide repeat protein [Catalinimonas alkaloidigena]SDM43272.1 Tetratricopeptide repeat-containing protein [Catalinimonas alkaloidigena]
MVFDPAVQRAQLLIEQKRFAQAEQTLRSVQAHYPQDDSIHALLAVCQLEQDRLSDAEQSAREAVRLQADVAFNHYILGYTLCQQKKLEEAERVSREALRLDSSEAHHYALLARIRMLQKKWEEALEFANQGLEQSAEDTTCLNLRAQCLTKLNRNVEARLTIEDALEQDPEDAFTHANTGWSLLEQGHHREAERHFGEALRLDPSMEFARVGLLEALKARNWYYRLFVKYYFWLGKQSSRLQWAVIIGLWLIMRVVDSLKDSNPAIAPYATAVLILYGIFVITTWIATPLFNLFLRFTKYGKHALSEREIRGTNWLGGIMLLCLVSFVAHWFTQWAIFDFLTGSSFLMVMVVGVWFQIDKHMKGAKLIRGIGIAIAVMLVLDFLTGFGIFPFNTKMTSDLVVFLLYAFVISVNYFAIRNT